MLLMDLSTIGCLKVLMVQLLWLLSEFRSTLSDRGFCQVYSYNVRTLSSVASESGHLREKHLFVCCDNTGQPSCKGHTYQKPTLTRGESLCSWIQFSSSRHEHGYLNVRTHRGIERKALSYWGFLIYNIASSPLTPDGFTVQFTGHSSAVLYTHFISFEVDK